MDSTDYVNVYIDILNKQLHKFISESALQETRIAVQDKNIQQLTAKVEELESVNSKLVGDLDKLKKKKNVVEDDFTN